MTRRRATVTVDEDPTGATTDAVNAGDTSSMSAWVSEAMAAKSDKRRLLAALPYAIEDFGADSARSPMKRWQGSVWEIAKLQQPSARSCTRRMMVLLEAGASSLRSEMTASGGVGLVRWWRSQCQTRKRAAGCRHRAARQAAWTASRSSARTFRAC